MLKKYLILLLLLAGLSLPALATDITLAAKTVPYTNVSGLPAALTGSATVTNGSATVTSSAAFRTQWPEGAIISLGGVNYYISSVASTSSLTLSSNYAGSSGSVTFTVYPYMLLRFYALQRFTTSDGVLIQSGTPGAGGFYKQVGATVISGTAHVPALTLPSTTDALNPGERNARWTAKFYSPAGAFIQDFDCLSQFKLPASPTTTTWQAVCTYNSPATNIVLETDAYTISQVQALLSSYYLSATGTTNYVQKKSGATSLGDSSIQDSGSAVTVGLPTTFSGTTAHTGAATFGSTVTASDYVRPGTRTRAQLATDSGVAGAVKKATDGLRDIYLHNGVKYYPVNSGTIRVEDFGCAGDYQEATTGNMTSGSATLTASSGSPFTLELVGRSVTVAGAGSGGSALSTTISAFVSATQVTLAASASTTVAGQAVTFSAHTDNATCFEAIESYVNSDKAHRVRFGSGRYRTSRGLSFDRPVTIEGNTSAINYNGEFTGTAIYFESGVTGITLNIQAQGSRVENLHLISGNGAAGTNDGLRIRSHATLVQNLVIYGFGQDGVNIDTSVSGNANGTTIINVRSQENWRHGFYWRGGDSQVTTCITCDASINRGYGYYNYDSGHNAWFNVHSDGNGTGYSGTLQNKADFFTNGSTLFVYGAYSEGSKWFVLGPSANALEAVTGTYAAPVFKSADCADGFTACTFTDFNPARGAVRQGGGRLGNSVLYDRAGTGSGRYYTWQNFSNDLSLLSNAPGGTDTRTYLEVIHDATGINASYTAGAFRVNRPLVFSSQPNIGAVGGTHRPGTVYANTRFQGPELRLENSGDVALVAPSGGLGGSVTLPNPGAGSLTLASLTGSETLTNKTLTSPVINGATLSGTLAGTPTFSGAAAFTGSPTFGSGGTGVALVKKASATLDFDLSAAASQDLTITLTGVASGDAVFLGVPNGSLTADTLFWAWCSAADTVTVRAMRTAGTPNPASGTFTVWVVK